MGSKEFEIVVTIKMSQDKKSELEALAETAGLKLSPYIRTILYQHIELCKRRQA